MKSVKNGFTFIELILVITIISILTAIKVPKPIIYIRESKDLVCNINCRDLERNYNLYLEMENVVHTENIFADYMQIYGKTVCPENKIISYKDGKIKCEKHSKDEEKASEDVPYI